MTELDKLREKAAQIDFAMHELKVRQIREPNLIPKVIQLCVLRSETLKNIGYLSLRNMKTV